MSTLAVRFPQELFGANFGQKLAGKLWQVFKSTNKLAFVLFRSTSIFEEAPVRLHAVRPHLLYELGSNPGSSSNDGRPRQLFRQEGQEEEDQEVRDGQHRGAGDQVGGDRPEGAQGRDEGRLSGHDHH